MTFITLESLKRIKSCRKGLKQMRVHYPEGAELLELYHSGLFGDEDYHWVKENMPLNEGEIEVYKEHFNIDNISGEFFFSYNLENSWHITHSNDISSSYWVLGSKNIKNSTFVVQSEDVEESKNVYDSLKIKNSDKIIKSCNISEGSELYMCNNINWGESLAFSKNTVNSTLSRLLTNSSNCHFSTNLNDCSNCLFCSNLEGKTNHVFNTAVNTSEFEKIRLVLLYSKEFKKISNFKINFFNYKKFRREPLSLLENLSEKGLEKIKKLDYYDEDIAKQLII